MPNWICQTRAVQYPDTAEPPNRCPICDDERQYVGWGGQRWTTMPELARGHSTVIREEEPGLYGVDVEPGVGIGQRVLFCRARGHGPAEPGFTDETGTRTFALCELMITPAWQARGVAHALAAQPGQLALPAGAGP